MTLHFLCFILLTQLTLQYIYMHSLEIQHSYLTLLTTLIRYLTLFLLYTFYNIEYLAESNLFHALNHVVIIAKYQIFLFWLSKASPSFEIFSLLLKEKNPLWTNNNNTLTNFRAKWATLCAWAPQNTLCLGECATHVLFTLSFIFIYVLLVLIGAKCNLGEVKLKTMLASGLIL